MSRITWNSEFLKTRDGILMSIQTGLGLLGGLVSVGLATYIETFIYWMTFLVSGIFLLSYSSSLIKTLEEKIPKIHLIVIDILFLICYPLHTFPSILSILLSGHFSQLWMAYTDLQIRILFRQMILFTFLFTRPIFTLLDFHLDSFSCVFDSVIFQIQNVQVSLNN